MWRALALGLNDGEEPSLILHADLCATVLTEKAYDTVGQPPSTEIGVPNMPSLKAKKAEQPPQENVLLEP